MRPVVIAAAFIAFAASCGAGFAQDPVATREPTMKDVGRAFGQVNRMNRGQDAYDGAKAAEAFDIISARAKTFATLFPDSSKSSGDDKALPTIWENKADFEARITKLSADAGTAAAAAPKGEAAFKAAFQTIQPQCGGCHQTYRAKEN